MDKKWHHEAIDTPIFTSSTDACIRTISATTIHRDMMEKHTLHLIFFHACSCIFHNLQKIYHSIIEGNINTDGNKNQSKNIIIPKMKKKESCFHLMKSHKGKLSYEQKRLPMHHHFKKKNTEYFKKKLTITTISIPSSSAISQTNESGAQTKYLYSS